MPSPEAATSSAELPFLFACRSAQDFARGGVRLLAALGIDTLAFGAESDDLDALSRIAAAIDAPETQERTGYFLRAGKSYAQALTAALQAAGLAKGNELHEANNILAVEYLRALRSTRIEPLLILRRGAGYHATKLQAMASATAIRQAMQEASPDWEALASALPQATYQALRSAFPQEIPSPDALLQALRLRLLTMDEAAQSRQYGLSAGEGLENRLQKAAAHAATTEDFLQGVITSRYPRSRIRRLIPHLLLQTPRDLVAAADSQGHSICACWPAASAAACCCAGRDGQARCPSSRSSAPSSTLETGCTSGSSRPCSSSSLSTPGPQSCAR